MMKNDNEGLTREEQEQQRNRWYQKLYANANPNIFENLKTEALASLSKNLNNCDLYTLALIQHYCSTNSGRNGVSTIELRELYKRKDKDNKLLFGERLITNSIGRLEIISAIESRATVGKIRTYVLKKNGMDLDILLYNVNLEYKSYVKDIESKINLNTDYKGE